MLRLRKMTEVVLVVTRLYASDDAHIQVCFVFQNAHLRKVSDIVLGYVWHPRDINILLYQTWGQELLSRDLSGFCATCMPMICKVSLFAWLAKPSNWFADRTTALSAMLLSGVLEHGPSGITLGKVTQPMIMSHFLVQLLILWWALNNYASGMKNTAIVCAL